MKSKVILKWTKWFNRALVVLIVVLINAGPWFYIHGYKPYGNVAEAVDHLVEYKKLYFNSYICFGVILIGLVLMVLSFIKHNKFKFFMVTLAVNILIMAALVGVGIILPITNDYEMSKVWWMAAACSVVLLITTVIGMVCEKNLNKQEAAESKNNSGVVAASIYGVIALALVITSIIIINDKGWRIEDDTLYLERSLGIWYVPFEGETLWGDEDFEELKVENGVREIHYIGLNNNEDLEEVDLPKSLRVIGEYTFKDCKNLYEIDIPDKVKEIGWCAFNGCENLVDVEFSEDLEVIDGWAFYGCNELSYVNLPDGLEVIGKNAFLGCSLWNITIPKTVKEIGENAFPDVTVLTVGAGSYAEQWAIENGYEYEIY